jgi:serine/threonine-protein kinase HipA
VALRAAGEEFGYPELALLLRRRAEADAFAAQGEQLFRRMVFNILIDNTDDHEQNHALVVNGAKRYALSPAYDVLPSGQAIGSQQLRVGRDGSYSTIANALSEHRSFALTSRRAGEICAEVALTVKGWRSHFTAQGVCSRDLDLLSEQIDRPFLREQRDGIT